MIVADVLDQLRSTERRIEKQEEQQRKQRKQAQREQEPALRNLEKLADGLIHAQEAVATHALKKRVGNMDRAVRGYVEPPTDYERQELQHVAQVAARNAARDRAEVEAHATADRETLWREERGRILRERAKLKREAEENGTGYLDPGPLSTSAPSWYLAPRMASRSRYTSLRSRSRAGTATELCPSISTTT